jgi:cellulose synthase operon protein YhjQ
MISIGIVSMKGGVGKTTVASNLAVALQKRNAGSVALIDLDPQNALPWHLGVADRVDRGLFDALEPQDVASVAIDAPHGVTCYPYGFAPEPARKALEQRISSDPNWLYDVLGCLDEVGHDIVVVDTPPGSSPYMSQVVSTVDALLIVLLPDGGSFATVEAMMDMLHAVRSGSTSFKTWFVLNQLDPSDELAVDVSVVLRDLLGESLLPQVIHVDESVREALAFQRPVLDFEPHGQASHDLDKLARVLLKEVRQ